MIDSIEILGVNITPLSWEETFEIVENAINTNKSEYICCCTVHTVMETQHNEEYRKCINSALLRTTDGMPLLWLSKRAGFDGIERIYGPDLMLKLCELSVKKGYRHFFYGGAEGVAEKLGNEMKQRYPGLKVSGFISPPYRELTTEEDQKVCRIIYESKADIIWVGLGTPKQDQWMASHKEKFSGIMFGVGAAFDFHTGRVKQAPAWMRRTGLEWFYRLLSDPKRLWRRYIIYNTTFLLNLVKVGRG